MLSRKSYQQQYYANFNFIALMLCFICKSYSRFPVLIMNTTNTRDILRTIASRSVLLWLDTNAIFSKVQMSDRKNEGSGNDSRGRQMRKCPRVHASTPSSSIGKGTKGQLFRQTSICARVVVQRSA